MCERVKMDDVLVRNPSSPTNDIQGTTSASLDCYLDELLKNTQTCTHTHTQVLSSGEDDKSGKPRRSLGNREAVRRFREKKKAHIAYLEEEVKKLRNLNQQLEKKLLGKAELEVEVLKKPFV